MSSPFFLILLLNLTFLSYPSLANSESTFGLMLAKTYKGQVNISHYWVSEKLDGVRAYWDGKNLISKQGNLYFAPAWFTKDFPDQALDGELWQGRGHFQQLLSTVTKKNPIEREWRKINYSVFDLPKENQPFTKRLKKLNKLVNHSKNLYLTVIRQYRLPNEQALQVELKRIVSIGGEGLMLHHEDSLYSAGRSTNILKVKPYLDAEAAVIAHIPGKGQFSGMLGSLLVETPERLQFRIGTGFNKSQRQSPPSIGSFITYKYHGKTTKDIPKFASFLRIRKNKK